MGFNSGFKESKYSVFRNAVQSGVLFIGLQHIHVCTFAPCLYTNSSNISATYGGSVPMNAVKAYGAMEVQFQSFLNSVLDRGEW